MLAEFSQHGPCYRTTFRDNFVGWMTGSNNPSRARSRGGSFRLPRKPPRSPLLGRYVQCEPLNPTIHAAQLYQAGHGSDEALRIWEYLPFGPWPDEVVFLAWLRNQAAAFDHIWFALRPHQSKRAAGMASYLDIHPLDGVIEIGGIWFGTELQRTRAATEALFLLLSYAMDDLGYRRMQWRCNSLNVKSRNAARRLGFRFEGIFYNHMLSKGRNRDTAWYSILDDEWPEAREIIKAWLSSPPIVIMTVIGLLSARSPAVDTPLIAARSRLREQVLSRS